MTSPTVTNERAGTEQGDVRWQGINHLALVTPDMDATVRFYSGLLGAQVVTTIATPEFRHYFFEFGPQCTVAFFEYRNESIDYFEKPAGVFDSRAPHFDHLSLNLPDEASLLALRRRLLQAGCQVTEVIDHGIIHSVYFTDPGGISLEASWWVRDPTDGPVDFDDQGFFADPDPVPALAELQRSPSALR